MGLRLRGLPVGLLGAAHGSALTARLETPEALNDATVSLDVRRLDCERRSAPQTHRLACRRTEERYIGILNDVGIMIYLLFSFIGSCETAYLRRDETDAV